MTRTRKHEIKHGSKQRVWSLCLCFWNILLISIGSVVLFLLRQGRRPRRPASFGLFGFSFLFVLFALNSIQRLGISHREPSMALSRFKHSSVAGRRSRISDLLRTRRQFVGRVGTRPSGSG